MEKKKILLEKLIKRNEILHPIVFVSFDTKDELYIHRRKIERERIEYFENQEQIRTLEWELMTPEEQQRQLEIAEKVKAKRTNFPK